MPLLVKSVLTWQSPMIKRSSYTALAALTLAASAFTQSWTPVKNVPPISAAVPLLLQDGSVIIQNTNAGDWHKLTPDSKGNYASGTWTTIATMPAGYTPEYFASAVLPDGRVVAIGGEYNGTRTEVWTNLGAIYNPLTNA